MPLMKFASWESDFGLATPLGNITPAARVVEGDTSFAAGVVIQVSREGKTVLFRYDTRRVKLTGIQKGVPTNLYKGQLVYGRTSGAVGSLVKVVSNTVLVIQTHVGTFQTTETVDDFGGTNGLTGLTGVDQITFANGEIVRLTGFFDQEMSRFTDGSVDPLPGVGTLLSSGAIV